MYVSCVHPANNSTTYMMHVYLMDMVYTLCMCCEIRMYVRMYIYKCMSTCACMYVLN